MVNVALKPTTEVLPIEENDDESLAKDKQKMKQKGDNVSLNGKKKVKKDKKNYVSITVPSATKEALETVADDKEISLAAIVKKYIAVGLLIERELLDGGELYIHKPKGEKVQILIS